MTDCSASSLFNSQFGNHYLFRVVRLELDWMAAEFDGLLNFCFCVFISSHEGAFICEEDV